VRGTRSAKEGEVHLHLKRRGKNWERKYEERLRKNSRGKPQK